MPVWKVSVLITPAVLGFIASLVFGPHWWQMTVAALVFSALVYFFVYTVLMVLRDVIGKRGDWGAK